MHRQLTYSEPKGDDLWANCGRCPCRATMRRRHLLRSLLLEIRPIGSSSPVTLTRASIGLFTIVGARSGHQSESGTPMRVQALAVFAIGTIAVAPPARAQTYSPEYPVCLHVYGRGSYVECGYTSIPQCQATAQGRSAQCELNPYFGSAVPIHPRHHRETRRGEY